MKESSSHTPVQTIDAKTDSPPLEVSKYDRHSDYNPHYECKMDKAHITMIGTYPIYMTYIGGRTGDSPELSARLEVLIEQQIQIKEYTLDGAYVSILNHADI